MILITYCIHFSKVKGFFHAYSWLESASLCVRLILNGFNVALPLHRHAQFITYESLCYQNEHGYMALAGGGCLLPRASVIVAFTRQEVLICSLSSSLRADWMLQ